MRCFLTLGLCLVAVASWAGNAVWTPEQQAEKERVIAEGQAHRAVLQQAPTAAEQAILAKAHKVGLTASPPGPTVKGAATPSKEERLAHWQNLPAEQAYRLFKEAGWEAPAELAQCFNSSLTSTPWTPDLRQAGGSPGTAVTIVPTNFGDSYTDHGNTALLSNYLTNVPYRYEFTCPQTAGYDANDGWYVFSISQPTFVTVTTCAATYYYDTRVGIFNTSLDLITGNDDNCGTYGLQSTVGCCLEPGTYYAVVDGYWTYAGEYDLTVSFQACPAVSPPTRGGGDAFGYTWINSFDADGPDFNWFDISAVGTPVVLFDDDYTVTPVPIGFAFPFYGIDRSQVYIGSNGMINFDGINMWSLSNTNLPDATYWNPNDLICPFWDDLNPGAGGTIHYYTDAYAERFIVQFTGVPHYWSGGPYTFQVILDQGGDILIQYLDMDEATIASATVGLENDTSTSGLTMNVDGVGGTIADGSCVRFIHPHPVQGGPDAYGYTWANSHAAGGPPDEWFDITGTTDLGLYGDDVSVPVALPFAFPFYGTSYISMIVTSNGWLGFNTSDPAAYYNVGIPNGITPNNAIYPCWDDFSPVDAGVVYYYYDSFLGRVIIQWTNIPHYYYTATSYTFQTILYPNGEIVLQYRNMDEQFAASSTVGLENADGSIGLQARYNTGGSVLEDNLAIRFTPPQPRPTRGSGSGYAWMNSLDPDGPDHVWTDISASGVNLGMAGDDQIVNVALPFTFRFYGLAQTQMQVCSNGWVGFNNDLPYYWNEPIPSIYGPNNVIYAFWDDLYLPYGGAVYYLDDSVHGRVIVQWHAVPHINGVDGPYTFQAQLYSNGEIYILYQDMGNQAVASATVGVENPVSTNGLQVSYDGTGGQLGNGITVEIHPLPRRPAAVIDLAITPIDFSPGNATVYMTFTPVTTDNWGNAMVVDHYLLLTVEVDPYAFSFPYIEQLPASYVGPGGPLHYSALGWFTSAYLYLVAVDTDGVLLGASGVLPWRTESEIPGTRGSLLTSHPGTAGAASDR